MLARQERCCGDRSRSTEHNGSPTHQISYEVLSETTRQRQEGGAPRCLEDAWSRPRSVDVRLVLGAWPTLLTPSGDGNERQERKVLLPAADSLRVETARDQQLCTEW